MSGEELTLVCSAQAEIHRQLKIEKVIEELEQSQEIEEVLAQVVTPKIG